MQGTFLILTIGIEMFLLVGYLFYLVFRAYAEGDDMISLMRWTIGLIGILTLGLIVSVVLVATRMTQTDLVVASALLIADIIGLYLLIDDIRRISTQTLVISEV